MVAIAHIWVYILIVIIVSIGEDVVEHEAHNANGVLEKLRSKLFWVVFNSIERRHCSLKGDV